jgi:flavin-dependent dehydrogenase
MAASQVIVIGGGLAGLSAAHTVLEHGGRVVLLDKVSKPKGRRPEAPADRVEAAASHVWPAAHALIAYLLSERRAACAQ